MKVAVTGATGIVGRFVVDRLRSEGSHVRALARVESDRRAFPDIDWITGDLTDGDAVRELLGGASAVVHCAYEHVPGRYRGGEGNDRGRFWAANLLASVELMEHARAAGIPRLVLMSSRAVYGRMSPAIGWVHDDDRAVPDTHYGALKLALEAHASAFSAVDGVCYASLRPTGVYGIAHPVERSKWFDLALALLRVEPLPPARLSTEVHGLDVAAAVWLLLTAPAEDVAGRSFNCSDLVVDTRAVMAQLAARLGRRAELPGPATAQLRHPMHTPALQTLGWRPGGERLLEKTIDELAEYALRNAPSAKT